ncbi:Nn.00g052310.m01.CDS01 [Neocucurbitaria sp. VM-36]
MIFSITTALAALLFTTFISASPSPIQIERRDPYPRYRITPKVFIFSMFDPEAEIWWGIPEFDILRMNITVPGFSPLFPDVHCTTNGEVCQLVTGEGEINAAVTIASLVASPTFDLSKTYFLIGGIAGVNPEIATVASVTFARYAVQVALQYEFDVRDIPENFTTGYIPQGSTRPDQYPQSIYGTEVFEVNDALRKLAVGFAKTATLNDSSEAIAYRAMYNTSDGIYAAGAELPSVVECDVATSDVYYSGTLLSEAFGNYTALVTNGSGIYCTTAQEDNATLEAMLRAHVAGLVDFSRIIIMRTASDMDRPYPGEATTTNLFWANQGAFTPAVQNIYLAGVKVVEGILSKWDEVFDKGVNATNYVGDIFGTIGGTPDFGPGTIFADDEQTTLKRRGIGRRQVKRGVELKGRGGFVYPLRR